MPISIGNKIKVLIVDDSLFARKFIHDGITKDSNIEVIAQATNANDARQKILDLKPDVVTLDVEMPGVSGIDFAKDFLKTNKVPIILVSSLNLRVFDALSAGAVDFVRKPDSTQNNEAFLEALKRKIAIAKNAKVQAPRLTSIVQAPIKVGAKNENIWNNTIVAIGASTGGTEAALEVLKLLPKDFPPVLLVQHMPVGFTEMYAQRLNKICQMEAKEAQDGDEIIRGRILLAPGDMQMRVAANGSGYKVVCEKTEKVSGHRPSVDALFTSVASNVRCKTIGVILTGMGADGANGLLMMKNKGAHTIGQDQDSCVVYGMPKEAFNMGAVKIQAPCNKIGNLLIDYLTT